jgi:ESF2/ABP1 family protein
MKYLPKFKWDMLTEQIGRVFPMHWFEFLLTIPIAHEAAVHQAKLRAELSQSRKEQREYLKNVELARVLEKRTERKLAAGQEPPRLKRRQNDTPSEDRLKKKQRSKPKPEEADSAQLSSVLNSVF